MKATLNQEAKDIGKPGRRRRAAKTSPARKLSDLLKKPRQSLEEKDRALARNAVRYAELLQVLGAVSLGHGQAIQGLALLHLAHKLVPADENIADYLAQAYLVNGEPDLALAILEATDSEAAHADARTRWETSYLRARSLLAAGRTADAQAHFARYVAPYIATEPST